MATAGSGLLRLGWARALSAGVIGGGVFAVVAQPAVASAASTVVGQAPGVEKAAVAHEPPAPPTPSPQTPQPRLGVRDAAYLAIAVALTAGSLTLVRRRRLLRLEPHTSARDPAGLPAAVWFAVGLAVYVAWLAGITGGAGLAHRLWPGIEPADLRFNAVTALGAYVVAMIAILAAGAWLTGPMRRAGLWRAPALRDIKVSLIALALVLPVILLLLAAGGLIEALTGGEPDPIAHDTLRSLRQAAPGSPWWWLVLAGAVVFAPIVEEWLYRGFVQTALRALTRSPWLAVVGSAVVFTLAHAGGVGADARTLPSLLALAVALGLLLERVGSIWPCVIAHAAFNALNVALALAIP